MTRRLLILLLSLGLLTAGATPIPAQTARGTGRVERLRQQRTAITEQFQAGVLKLIASCREQQQAEALEVLQQWQTPVESLHLTGQPLPKEVQPEIPNTLSAADRAWRIELRRLREETAQTLYLLSRQTLTAGSPSLAWQLIREAAWYDADHEKVRRLLGYERYQNQWTTPFTAQQLRKGNTWHEQFGWLPAGYVERYDNGERYFRGQWMPAARETETRRDFRNAWQIETDNFLVKTNISQEAGTALAKRLEVFHTFFRQMYPGFFDSPEQLQKLFLESSRTARKRQAYEVHVFRTKGEYIDRLKKDNPQIEITNGIYMASDRVSYFFDNPAGLEDTLYHEATHQFLFERFTQPRRPAEREHFWVIEGLACYMESFRNTDKGPEIGSPKHIRLAVAQARLTEDGYFVPLKQFAEMGQTAFQNNPNIVLDYTQAAGLAHFFMEFDDGRYRDAFIEHVAAIYSPQAATSRVKGLDVLTGVPAEELDQQYRSYITGLVTQ